MQRSLIDNGLFVTLTHAMGYYNFDRDEMTIIDRSVRLSMQGAEWCIILFFRMERLAPMCILTIFVSRAWDQHI